MAEARIPNMRGIMAARTKPLKVVEASAETLTQVAEFGLPPAKAGVKLVAADNVDELVRMLHDDARVI
jgi:electron transfer flavoprotein beta subunit